MPELPEVETIVAQLKQKIIGNKVIKVEVLDSLVEPKIKDLTPFRFIDVRRRAKYIIMCLDNGKYFLVHLGMTGLFYFVEKAQLEQKKKCYQPHLLATFTFNDGSILTHNSVRKIGSFRLMEEKELNMALSKLGPEPLDSEFTLGKFKEMLTQKSRAKVKVTLMDQSFIAGIGNIYAQEALYHAGINPERKIGSLNSTETKKLYESIILVLKEGIKHKGTSVDEYIHLEGAGENQKYLRVYRKKKCPQGHLLKKEAMGGRGTSYCPVCQK
ncbi:bifunctional DNA-formamidopyrimidine glycosylase/DNA-(apurinic or apyrimidinic site) lyase [Candidatus Woesearchaeota archaeon]|nr:bifunctional DNA-formamidopyrimidine glycosylase/DNA-(apurinic or apyrimidinic site) lyase [Candidatus Woesearchaeota archaeon]